MPIPILYGLVVPGLAALATAGLVYGHWRSRTAGEKLRAALDASRTAQEKAFVDFREVDGLPAPVRRYFRMVLEEGAPMVTGARVTHQGYFNMGRTAERWKPFTSDQQVGIHRPGFDWDARIALWPGLSVRVHDAYIAGEGILRATLFGLLTVADMRGGGEIAEGELMRFLAEAAWYPTALLPSQGVSWEAVDAGSAHASLADGPVHVRMLFQFDENGLIASVSVDGRGRTVDGRIVSTPWQGRFWHYEHRHGMYVPQEGEASWIEPGGAQPYWRGTITAISYAF